MVGLDEVKCARYCDFMLNINRQYSESLTFDHKVVGENW